MQKALDPPQLLGSGKRPAEGVDFLRQALPIAGFGCPCRHSDKARVPKIAPAIGGCRGFNPDVGLPLPPLTELFVVESNRAARRNRKPKLEDTSGFVESKDLRWC